MLTAAGVSVEGQRLPYILSNAELEALICSGPRRGKQHTYVLLEDRAPDALELCRDDALAELARRYFTSHGPATAKDFATWASLTLAEVRLSLDAAGSALRREDLDGVALWSGAAGTLRPRAPGIPHGPPGAGLRRVPHGLLRDEACARSGRARRGRRPGGRCSIS